VYVFVCVCMFTALSSVYTYVTLCTQDEVATVATHEEGSVRKRASKGGVGGGEGEGEGEGERPSKRPRR
jgi:hypothetical protein